MGQVVERIADIRFGEHRRAQLAREHERGDPGDLRLERDHLQVHQQLQMLLERRRHTGGQFRNGQIVWHALFSALNPPLDLAHVIEILRQAATIIRRQIFLQRRHLPHHRVEEAARLLPSRAAFGIRAASSEQFLEDQPRVVLHRQR